VPLISVIIPVYNGEKTIQKTIESVLGQTFSDFELLVIDDGSLDSTLAIIQQIKDPRLKIFSKENAGVAASRNYGLSHASSPYVSFLDADDLWAVDKLESQLNTLENTPQAAVVYSWTNWIDESGNFLRRGSYISATGDVYAKLLLIDFIESGSNPLIRTQAFAEVGGFDESLPADEDWEMWLRLAARYTFVVVPSVQIFYRVSVNSRSSNILNVEAASLQVIEQARARVPNSVEYLMNDILANRYKCLTFKSLEGCSERRQGLLAARFLWHAVSYDPSLLRAGVFAKVLFRIMATTLLSPQQAQVLFAKFKKLSHIEALLGYLRLDPF
jgi:glycosyltransferase involved in cell wall biosynthesis